MTKDLTPGPLGHFLVRISREFDWWPVRYGIPVDWFHPTAFGSLRQDPRQAARYRPAHARTPERERVTSSHAVGQGQVGRPISTHSYGLNLRYARTRVTGVTYARR